MNINLLENHLKEKGLNYKRIGDLIRIKCIFQDHKESIPSLTLYPTGTFYCFGCKKWGNIKDLFKLQYKGLKVDFNEKIYIDNKISSNSDLIKVDMPESEPVKFVIRGISLKTLHRFNVRVNKLGYIIPIFFNNYLGKRCIGYSIRKYNNNPKWLHLPAERTINGNHFSRYLYPIFHNINYIILVEGLFDMLKLIDEGFLSSCCFNTNFTKEKLFCLYKMAPKYVFIIFDNDKAGKEGAIKFKKELKKDFIVKIIHINKDPDEFLLNSKNSENLKKYIRSEVVH